MKSIMKKRTHLHTNFVKFLVEKYKKEVQELPDEETKNSKKELTDEFDEIINDKETPKKGNEIENEDEDEDLDTLLKEYLTLEKKYKLKRNDSLFKRK